MLGKGWRCADVLLGTSHSFTRDVLCYWVDEAGFHLRLRPHAPGVRKCGEADITSHAEGIIATMRAAKAQGRTVMFYSCIIGSIPGETATAIALVRAFVDSLREKMDNILIINPAEHFVDGMDGDDLMYMLKTLKRASPCWGARCRRAGPARTPPSPRAAPRKCASPWRCRPGIVRCKSSAPRPTCSSAGANMGWANILTPASPAEAAAQAAARADKDATTGRGPA